jgi:hypothetical protein
MVPTPDDGGYWLASSDGRIYHFGNAPFRGSIASAIPLTPAIVSMVGF